MQTALLATISIKQEDTPKGMLKVKNASLILVMNDVNRRESPNGIAVAATDTPKLILLKSQDANGAKRNISETGIEPTHAKRDINISYHFSN